MMLILTIENEQSLPNGAPVSVRLTDRRGIDIGRSATIDWPLPDPTRFISGRHCEVRYRDDGYWLNDLSTNGTFLNDSTRRVQAPYKLRHGDRLAIGSYVIAVSIESDDAPDSDVMEAAAGEAPEAENAALAPIRPEDAAAFDPHIAQAIIEGAAPAPEPRLGPEALTNGAGVSGAGVLEAAPPSRDVNAAGRDSAPALPFTMVRARGFFTAPAPREEAERPAGAAERMAGPMAGPLAEFPAEWSPAPPARPAQGAGQPPLAGSPTAAAASANPLKNDAKGLDARGSDVASLDARDLEALAWSAPERAPPLSAPADFQPILDEQPNARVPGGQSPYPQTSDLQAPDAHPPEIRSPAPQRTPGADEFLRCFAKGAGIPEHVFARQDGLKVAEDLGALMRMAVEDLTQLLSARFKAKRFARTSSQTMIQALDNNPLKFAPTADDALKIMFGPRTSGYLDAKRAFEGAFTDLKTHQVNTFAAMQQAVRMLIEDLDPKAIEQAAGEDKGLAALFGAHKARLWDLFLARWQAKSLRHEDGLVDAFMLYFAQCYDQAKESK